ACATLRPCSCRAAFVRHLSDGCERDRLSAGGAAIHDQHAGHMETGSPRGQSDTAADPGRRVCYPGESATCRGGRTPRQADRTDRRSDAVHGNQARQGIRSREPARRGVHDDDVDGKIRRRRRRGDGGRLHTRRRQILHYPERWSGGAQPKAQGGSARYHRFDQADGTV
ncbi:MAG: hypothetical protein AVDCRST_MAG42-599, partial [uncultured Chthoniobacterales bacterium]